MKTLERIFARLGFVGKERERSLLFIGSNVDAIEALSDVFEEIMSRDSRLRIILASSDAEVRAWARQRFPTFLMVPLPYENRLSAGLYLRQLKIRAVAFVESAGQNVAAPFIAKLQQLAIGVVTVSGRSAATLESTSIANNISEAVVVIGDDVGRSALSEGITLMSAAQLGDTIDVMLARNLKALRKPGRIIQCIAEAPAIIAASSRWRRSIAWRVRSYQNIDTLKQRLASPKTIMCLGNGPSSEAVELETMSYDVLFRVNHSWLKRGQHVKADVVFTGGKPSMRAISKAIFGVQTRDAERSLLMLRTYNPLFGPTEFFNINNMNSRVAQYNWGHLRPTNGVCMLATAIALKPEKLIVAGIDLFQHPAGSYPGDNATANAYSPGHSRETELGFVLDLLGTYQGEIIVVGEILRKALENHKLNSS